MKNLKAVGLTIFLLCVAQSGAAWAHGHSHHGGSHVGVFVGVPIGPWYYPAPYYYPYPPAVMSAPSAPVYIEQQPAAAYKLEPGYWYYCHHPEGYYPYIKQCAGGWQKVSPFDR